MSEQKERLDSCQQRLVESGYEDVKFFFTPNSNCTLSEAATEAADVLEAILDKRSVEAVVK